MVGPPTGVDTHPVSLPPIEMYHLSREITEKVERKGGGREEERRDSR